MATGAPRALMAANSVSGSSAKEVSASASSTTAASLASAASTRLRRCSPTPAPGPIITAFLRSSAKSAASSAASSTMRTMMAVSAPALTSSASRGEATVTSPAPARSAPRAPSLAAPVLHTGPDTTTAWPRAYLWLSGLGHGKCASQRAGSLTKARGRITSSTLASMPISATLTSPQSPRPGSSKCPGLSRKKVTVARARIATPRTAPVVPSMPLGTSTATTGSPLAFTASINAASSPSIGRASPAPKIASTTTSAWASSSTVKGSMAPSQSVAMAAASSGSRAGSPARPSLTA